MSKKKVLVTGAAGFVGKHLVRLLLEKGLDVRAMVRANTDISFLKDLNVEIIEADLRIKDSLYPALAGIDYVVHLATTMQGPWEEYLETTVRGTERLLEISKSANIKKFIYISTIAVSDLTNTNGKVITEDTPYAKEPLSYYDRSKIQAEGIVMKFANAGLPCAIIRPGVIYGPYGKLYPSRLGYSFGNNRFVVIGNGYNHIPVVYVHNLLDAIYLALESPNSNGEIFNAIDDQDISQRDYLYAVKREINSSLKISYIPYFLARLTGILLDLALKVIKKQSPLRKAYLIQCSQQIKYSNEKIKKELGWKPRFKAEEGLLQTMKWHHNKIKSFRDVDFKRIKGSIYLKKPLKLGIAGCGWIAETHLVTLKKIKNLNIAAFCDTDINAAKKLTEKFGKSAIYTDFDEMLNKEKLDVVHILTPPQSHQELTLKACQKKCHILVEKPMAMDAEDARLMVEAAKANNVKLCVNHNHLYDPIMLQARRLIHSGALGEVVYVDSWYGFNLGANLNSRYMLPGAEKHWALNLPGRLYQNLLPHPLSVLADVIGYPDELYVVAASGGIVKAMADDELRIMAKSNGKIGLISVSLAVSPRYQYLNIYGTKMSLFLDFLTNSLVKHSTPKMIPKPISRAFMNLSTARIITFATIRNFWKVLNKTFTPYEGTEILIKEFYRSIDEDSKVPVSGEEGLKSMEIMDRIWETLRENKKLCAENPGR